MRKNVWYTAVMSNARSHWESLRVALIWIGFVIITILIPTTIVLASLVVWIVDPQYRSLHRMAEAWGRAIFLLNPGWRISVAGRGFLKPSGTYLIVANHQSLFDIMALYHLHRQFKWVAKAELFSIPFLGWAMSAARYIQLHRGKSSSIRQTYGQARRYIEEGMSVVFFPEGTRSHTSTVQPFKNGAFKLAIRTGVPVVPVAVSGARDLLPRQHLRFAMTARVRVQVLPPLDPKDYRPEEFDRLRDDAHRAISRALEQHGKVPRVAA